MRKLATGEKFGRIVSGTAAVLDSTEELDVLKAGELAEQYVLLRADADDARGAAPRSKPSMKNVTGSLSNRAANNTDGGRFARAVRTKQTSNAAARHLEVQIVDCD